MTIEMIKNSILESFSVFSFEYKGKIGGIDPISDREFIMWYGDSNVTVNNINNAMILPIFDNKSLTELIDKKLINKKNLIEYSF